MLVFFMVVGTVLCSPVSLTPYRQATSEKNVPHSSSSPIRVESALTVGGPSSPFANLQDDSIKLEDDRGARFQAAELNFKVNEEPKKYVLPLHQPEDDHSTINLDSKLKRIGRRPRNSILPPLILAHHSSELSLEPTEVEAPGTTPTTLAMITESTITTIQNSTNKPSLHNMKKSSLNIESTSVNSSTASIGSNSQVADLDSPGDSSNKSTDDEKNDSLFQDIDSVKDKHQESMLEDNHSTELHNESNKDSNNRFIIKALNNTYTLVHEKSFSTSQNGSSKVPGNISSEEVHSSNKNADLNFSSKNNESFGHEVEGDDITAGISESRDKIFETTAGSKQNNKGTKRTVTAAELLLNITNHRALLDSISSRALNHNRKIEASEVLIEEEKVQDDKYIDSVLLGAEREDDRSEKEGPSTILDTGMENTKGTSNIETREVDNNSYFILVNSELAPKIVKKDDSSIPKSQDEGRYRMDVITSSSEVTYKQFDPLKNSSVLSNLDSDTPSGDGHNDIKSLDQETPRNLSSNSTIHNTTSAKELTLAAENTKERSLEVNVSAEDQIVTSLPSQTSVVEPLRANTSSTVAESTLPSHHRTKSDQSVASSHAISSAVASDAIGRSPLGLFPPDDASSSVDTPSVQQERLSTPVAEEVTGSISAGCVVAILSGVLITMVIIGGSIAYVLYRRLEGFRPKILSPDRSCANSDSGGYLDDQCRVAYVNSQIDLPKSTPEDLVSLDNDSFLNSLESMTIQNLWTDSIRHTKL